MEGQKVIPTFGPIIHKKEKSMEHKFKIGELVKVVDTSRVFRNHQSAAKSMDLLGYEDRDSFQADFQAGKTAMIVGMLTNVGPDGNALVFGIRMTKTGEAYVCGVKALESLDNPPTPKKELTHMAVFRAIHAGVLPAWSPNISISNTERIQSYWSTRNGLHSIQYFVDIENGATLTVDEVVERFGK